jgi:hypothetical protein
MNCFRAVILLLCYVYSCISGLTLNNLASKLAANIDERTCKDIRYPFPYMIESTVTKQFYMHTTDVMIKPDGVQRRLIGKIIGRFEDKGLTLKAMKLTTPTTSMLQKHYEHLRDMPIFSSLLKFMSSGPVVAMVSPVRIWFIVVLIVRSVNRYGKGETR